MMIKVEQITILIVLILIAISALMMIGYKKLLKLEERIEGLEKIISLVKRDADLSCRNHTNPVVTSNIVNNESNVLPNFTQDYPEDVLNSNIEEVTRRDNQNEEVDYSSSNNESESESEMSDMDYDNDNTEINFEDTNKNIDFQNTLSNNENEENTFENEENITDDKEELDTLSSQNNISMSNSHSGFPPQFGGINNTELYYQEVINTEQSSDYIEESKVEEIETNNEENNKTQQNDNLNSDSIEQSEEDICYEESINENDSENINENDSENIQIEHTRNYTFESLNVMRRPHLNQLCDSMGINKRGNKNELIGRILESQKKI